MMLSRIVLNSVLMTLVITGCKFAGQGEVTSGAAIIDTPTLPVGDLPQSQAAVHATARDTLFDGTLYGYDAESRPLTFTIVSHPARGSVVILDANLGSFRYTPTNGASGIDSFTYRVNNGQNDSSPSQIRIAIANVRPTLSAISNIPGASEDTPFVVSHAALLAASNAADADGDPISFLVASVASGTLRKNGSLVQPGSTLISAGENLSWTPALNANGLLSAFSLRAHDGVLASSGVASVSVQVASVNDAPTITSLSPLTINEDSPGVVNFSISDVETTLTCTATHLSLTSSDPTLLPTTNVVWSGTAPYCTATLSPATNQWGTSTVGITVSDGSASTLSNFLLTVAGLADDAFTYAWPFDFGSDISYVFDSARIALTGGSASLRPIRQTHDSAADFDAGTHLGSTYSSSTLRAGNAGGCDGTLTNCSELAASWTPRWSNLIGYWPLNGTGPLADGATIAAVVGSSGTLTLPGGSSVAHSNGKMKTGLHFQNSPSDVSMTTSQNIGPGNAVTLSAWVNNASLVAGSRRYITFVGDYAVLRWDTMGGGYNMRFYFYDTVGNLRSLSVPDTTEFLAPGTWYHVVGTWDGLNSRIYINAREVAQTTFPGTALQATNLLHLAANYGEYPDVTMDDVAVWNTSLSADEIKLIYDRQSPRYASSHTSTAIDVGAWGHLSALWSSLSWRTPLPVGKSLPSLASSEGPSDYPDISSNLMSGNVGLWRFEETAASTGANNDFRDYSGNSNHGEQVGAMGFASSGRVGTASTFNGGNGIVIPDSNSLDVSSTATFSVWVNPDLMDSHHGVFQKVNTDADPSYMLYVGTNNEVAKRTFRPHIFTSAGAWRYGSIDYDAEPRHWYHVVFTYNSASGQMRGYINGTEYPIAYASAPVAGETIRVGTSPLYLGQDTRGGSNFRGKLDEFAIWNRVLSPAEVTQIYQRGASNIKFQIRSCSQANCADNPTWKGPDNTPFSYFSEIHNNEIPATGTGNVLGTAPSLDLSKFPLLTLAPARYFQYRSIFESEASLVADRAKLTSVTIGPDHYDDVGTPISGVDGDTYLSLTQLTETLGASGCPSGVRHQLSRDKITWYYWSGSSWSAASQGYVHANTLAALNTKVASFPTTVGTGTIYVRSYLKSNGYTPCELDNLSIEGHK